jgi:hypothetical protein
MMLLIHRHYPAEPLATSRHIVSPLIFRATLRVSYPLSRPCFAMGATVQMAMR